MKLLKVITGILLIVTIITLLGCSGKANSTTSTTQTATVQRGNLVVSTTSTGNLAFTRTEDIAFDMAGTVEEVMVETGDSVTEGEVLATLDTAVWYDQLKMLEKAVTTAENNLANTESNIGSQELAVRQAQINLMSAQSTVAQIPAVKAAQNVVDILEISLKTAKASYGVNPSISGTQIQSLQNQLDAAQENLKAVLAGTSFNLSSNVALQIAKAQLAVDQTQKQLDDSNRAVISAKSAKDDAEEAVKDAQSALENAQGLSPKVTAPFAGVVTKVNVQGGQEINKGAVAVQIADPTKFEVGILVGERDISSITIGGTATVSVDSMTGVTMPATVTAIAPTATIQQGVVNYQVTVEIRTISSSSGNNTFPLPSGGMSGGQFPGNSPTNGAQSSQSSDNQSIRNRTGNFPSGGGLFTASQSATLRQGLSVTVNLITTSKTNVLMVPVRAVIRQQGKTYVDIEKNGKTERVPITTGISNSQYTEITEGVTEGDTVVFQVTTSTSSSNQGGGGFFPGGGILR